MRQQESQWEPLEQEIQAVLEAEGYELVLMEVLGHTGRHILRLRIDKPGGVTIGDCERVTHRLSALLDVLDPFPSSYQLEVSSPGIERPLVKPSDFERFAGRKAKVVFLREGRKQTVVGILRGWREAKVIVEGEGEEWEIPYSDIQKAQLQYDWDAE